MFHTLIFVRCSQIHKNTETHKKKIQKNQEYKNTKNTNEYKNTKTQKKQKYKKNQEYKNTKNTNE